MISKTIPILKLRKKRRDSKARKSKDFFKEEEPKESHSETQYNPTAKKLRQRTGSMRETMCV